jgi:hypothetical protein
MKDARQPEPTEDRMTRHPARRALALVTTIAALALAVPAQADKYDPQKAGHPMRILAYVVHPVGVLFDLLIFRPAHWLGSKEPLATVFGHEPYRD